MEQDGTGVEGDDFIFNEYAIDDTLDPLQRLVKYHTSDFSLQRLVLIRELGDTAAFAGFADTLGQLVPLLRNFVQDSEPTVRHVFAQQLHPLASYLVTEGGDAGYQEFLNTLLPFAVELLVDKNVEVGSAAMQSLLLLAGLVKEEHVDQHLLQVLLTLAKDERAEDYRVVAAQLFDELIDKMGADLCDSTILPEIKLLSNDASFSVRRTVALSLRNTCRVLGTAKADSNVLPIYLGLCRDEVWGVRKACAEAIVGISRGVSTAARQQLVPAFKALFEDSSRWVRVAAYQNVGQFIHSMNRDDVSSMFLKIFTDMAFQSEGGDSEFAEYCAFSFPAVASVMGPERWRELDDAYATLLKDLQWKVRKSLSHSLHEIAQIVGTSIADKSLTVALELFLRDVDEVKLGVIHKVDVVLGVLTPSVREKYISLICSVPLDSENWRLRFAVASKLGLIAQLVPAALVSEHIVDLVLRLLEDSVMDVRCSSYFSTAAVLKRLDEDSNRTHYNSFSQSVFLLATRTNYQSRQMFTYIAQQVFELGATEVGNQMLEYFPDLAADRVPNVRYVVARVLAHSANNKAAWKDHPKVQAAVTKLKADVEPDIANLAKCTTMPQLETPETAMLYRPE
jgi:serine/threonine-protein phosphatase 4 regulatory subunit 1